MEISIGLAFFVLMMIFGIGYLVGKGIDNNRKGYNGATQWKEYMWCEKCKSVFPQYGLHPSVYNCPNCGEKTKYAMARYVAGELEVKKR